MRIWRSGREDLEEIGKGASSLLRCSPDLDSEVVEVDAGDRVDAVSGPETRQGATWVGRGFGSELRDGSC